jgi:hypothetical protein
VILGLIFGTFTIAGEIALVLAYYFDPEGIGITSSIVSGEAMASTIGAVIFFSEHLSLN